MPSQLLVTNGIRILTANLLAKALTRTSAALFVVVPLAAGLWWWWGEPSVFALVLCSALLLAVPLSLALDVWRRPRTPARRLILAGAVSTVLPVFLPTAMEGTPGLDAVTVLILLVIWALVGGTIGFAVRGIERVIVARARQP